MSTFQDRVRAALTTPTASQASNEFPPEFEEVLVEFVQALEEAKPSLGAAIETGNRTQIRSFVAWPRYRRDERTIMLTFYWDGSVVRVVGDQEARGMDVPDELRDYLLKFLTESEFRFTLEEFEHRCKEDLTGFVRTKSLVRMSVDDVMVTVTGEAQEQLATVAPGHRLSVRVRLYRVSGMGTYEPSKQYGWLSSGGYGLRITEHRQEGEDIVITGTVMEDGATE